MKSNLAFAELPQPGEFAALVLVPVEKSKSITVGGYLLGWVERGAGSRQGPEAGSQDGEGRIETLNAEAFDVLFETGVEILRNLDILKHALQLVGVLEAAGLLQLADHACLGIV